MTSADLIWRLIELSLKDKETKSDANEQKRLEIILEVKELPLLTSFFLQKKN